jgi:hypothetical protein
VVKIYLFLQKKTEGYYYFMLFPLNSCGEPRPHRVLCRPT